MFTRKRTTLCIEKIRAATDSTLGFKRTFRSFKFDGYIWQMQILRSSSTLLRLTAQCEPDCSNAAYSKNSLKEAKVKMLGYMQLHTGTSEEKNLFRRFNFDEQFDPFATNENLLASVNIPAMQNMEPGEFNLYIDVILIPKRCFSH